MADEAIVDRAVEAAPKDYVVGGGVELALKAVRAVVDGSGAAGSFEPCLQLVAPDGTVMWTAVGPAVLAAGASADVSWFPGSGGGAGSVSAGTVLQVYGGIAPASNFVWTVHTGAFQVTNFPTNTTLNKISNTSLLLCHLEGDFVAGPNLPDVITMSLSVDGGNTQSVGHHVSFANGFFSVDLSRFIGVGNTGLAPLPAGAHTIQTQVWNLTDQGVGGVTARTSTSWNLEIIEIEGP